MGICLEAGAGVTVLAYINASFAVHGDISWWRACVFEALKAEVNIEVVNGGGAHLRLRRAPSGNLDPRLLTAQGYMRMPAKIFQDNQSAIVLANKDFSTREKTRHIGIRYYFIKDRIDGGQVEVEYMGADIMTKPLQVSLFRKLRGMLMDWE